jgi:signal transduction histidine kinase
MKDVMQSNSHSDMPGQPEFYQAWLSIIRKLSHDLIGDLAMIRQKNKISAGMLPSLLKGYRLAIDNHLMESEVKEKYLDSLDDLNPESHIAEMIDHMHLLNDYCEQMSLNSPDIKILSAMDCINELLNQHPFENDKEKVLVHITDGNNFQFKCSPIFIHSLMNNLLTNGLRSIKKAGKGSITIWLSQEEDFNTLNLKDTGLGLSNEQRLSIFDRFLSKHDNKSLPGLGFCKTAIQYAGGDVICQSLEGKFTHFIVKFPR